MYKLKDISIVIPSYNRSTDLKEKTLKSILPYTSKIGEIIVVDQSTNDETKKFIQSIRKRNVRCIRSSPPSITIARNTGVKHVSKNTKIVLFLDDDIRIGKEYFSQILKVFNENSNVYAVGGYQVHEGIPKHQTFQNFLRKIFYLGHFENNGARMISAYGNNYPFELKKTISSDWLPGFNMAFRREVFSEQEFDTHLLGYTIAEDTDFTYSVAKKHLSSVYITPFAKIDHLTSKVERLPSKKMSYVNQIDHFYLNFKHFNQTFSEKLIFIWGIWGIFILRTMKVISRPNKIETLKYFYFLTSLFYCLMHLKKIRLGKLRDFTIKEEIKK